MKELLTWYKQHGRHDLPWRHTCDPYKILVSELMLQQTQVPRVIPKYTAFVKKWPTIQKLAKASRKDVLRMWQGLGYNSRAVRLHALAKVIVSEYNGKLPASREELLMLPGVGPYTAGAIMIFAHDKKAESVDVNVLRVVKRVFWSKRSRPSDSAVKERALSLLTKPHDVQSALMDFGSSYCTATPKCDLCPLYKKCKSKGARSDEIKVKQAAFKGSVRQLRGKILKELLKEEQTKKQLQEKLKSDSETFKKALDKLLDEKLIQFKKGKYVV